MTPDPATSVVAIFWDYLINTFLILAPVFLFGLFISGTLRVLISREQVLGLMGRNDIRSSVMAAFAGIPIPLCSCSVLPAVTELRKKGASKSACASFLVATPETGVDSIPVTYALLGPFMAVFRPVASLLSAVFTSTMVIGLDEEKSSPRPEETGLDHCCDHGHDDDDYVGVRGLWLSMSAAARSAAGRFWRSSGAGAGDKPRQGAVPLRRIFHKISRHAFVEQMDEMLFPLVIGVLAGGLIVVALPADLSAYGISGPVPYLLLLAAGVPIYICASATTPIAAALILKGVSPGAALVFLLSGPATNSATIAVLGRYFGWRFTAIYVVSIAVSALAAGIVLDIILARTAFQVIAQAGGLMGGVVGLLQIAGLAAFTGLAVWRARANPAILPQWTGGVRFSLSNFKRAAVFFRKAASRIRR